MRRMPAKVFLLVGGTARIAGIEFLPVSDGIDY